MARHGDYPAMIRRWLGVDAAECVTIPVLDGALPGRPTDADFWVFTGSRCGVYEGHDWIAPLETFIRDCSLAKVRLLGICFGHQLIAQALGGTVQKSSKGWGLGVHRYSVDDWDAKLGPRPSELLIEAYHQDQVTVAPASARVLAGSDFCPHAVLYYQDFALTIQGHPEFTADYAADLIELRRGTVFDDETANKGLATVRDVSNSHLAAETSRTFAALQSLP